ncbi:hypothetical protein GDO86_014105 [Hymenochirus boettgeri]|uniref:TBC1 domain family member 16 n=1 Tax=Hymenochirus boettgeri TaxID=247094 RepID=A0A8T2JSX8_9PIPI|nr:hypothetical protein GDO86_014105 [Hymenochirus boettgeri]
MSFGRLLHRASSKASDLLTLGSGGGSSSVLDGEIIFSKNNVCVHPPELLQDVGSHHPGYLCVYLEKDEFLGTTLILAWVPNSRIQRQDEEALRYITPESSPVRKNPCKRNRQPPGTAPTPQNKPVVVLKEDLGRETESSSEREPSYDEVSKDSTLDSDSDAFSSPFCLSPISEALGESSGSVFLENESRDEGNSHMISYSSSLNAPSQLREINGQGVPARWEEQQKLLALEQTCGVFRVDLGQMRSLRLFFSDEACTSGQLVVASRESQYKVFHFHHGGLGKLSEVFQQWKYCRETQLKDQVTEEKTCLHFSIQRPNLPSSESHPEEGMYHRLDVSSWLQHLNEAGQVEEEYKLRKVSLF